MTTSDHLLENADNCRQLALDATSLPAARRFARMAEAWRALAREQDWLDGRVPPASPDAAMR